MEKEYDTDHHNNREKMMTDQSFENIFEAAKSGSVEDVKYFVETLGIDVNAKNEDGWTPLHIAAYSHNSLEMLQLLVAQGADAHVINNKGETLLHTVAGRGGVLEDYSFQDVKIEFLKYLVSLGIDVNVKDEEGETLLHHAVLHDSDVEVLRYLVSQGADAKAKTKKGWTLLHSVAAYEPSEEILKYIVSQCIEGYTNNEDGENPLCRKKLDKYKIEILQYLVSHGHNINAKDKESKTLLHYAAKGVSIEIVQYLVSHGADILAMSVRNWTVGGAL